MTAPAEPGRPAASRLALVLAFATIYVVWGSTYLGIRIAVETLPPFLMAGARVAIAGIVLFAGLLLWGVPLPRPSLWRDQAIIGVLLLFGGNSLVSWSEVTVPSGITSLILGSAPVLVVLGDWVRPGGSRPTLSLVVGVVLGLAGLALLLGPGSIPAGYRPPPFSVAVLVLSSASWWVGSFYSKHVKSEVPLLMAAAMQMICGSALMLAVAWAAGEVASLRLAAVSAASWAAFAYLVTIGSLVVFPVYIWLLEHSTPAKISTFAYVNPVIAVVLGWAVLGEPLNIRIILASIVIIGAVAVISVTKSRAGRAA